MNDFQGDLLASDLTTTRRRRSSLRWIVALLTTAFMLVASLGVVTFAQSTTAAGPTFLPATSLAYAEARLDLPGDQREQVLAFLGHFPGFADPASFDTKVDDALEQLLGGSDAPLSWKDDIKPWFGGQIMLGLPVLPDMSVMSMRGGTDASVVAALGVTDRAALDATLTKLMAGTDATSVTTEDYAGTTIYSHDEGSGVTALAPTESLLLASNDLDQLKASLDVLAGTQPSLADDPAFQASMASLPADRLAAFYVNTATLADQLASLHSGQSAGDMGISAAQLQMVLDLLPTQVTGYLRADADHVTVAMGAIPGPNTPTFTERETDLAAHMPPDTIVYAEGRDLGGLVSQLVTQVKATLTEQGDTDQIEQIEALLGASLDTYLDWVQDVALGVSYSEAGPSFGLIGTVTDEVTGAKRLNSLITLVRIIASVGEEPPITISDSVVDGVNVTTFTLTDATSSGMDLPFTPSVSIALGNGLLYIGLGDFAAQAITRDPADSLAANPTYVRALAAAGTPNGGLSYVDLASAVGLAETLMGSDDAARFETEVKPYLDSLDFLVGVLDEENGTLSAKGMLFVK